jgi:phosphoserine aminotransferase
LKAMPEIHHIDANLHDRIKKLENCIVQTKSLRMLVDNAETRSTTVLAVTGPEETITKVKMEAKEAGMELGGGYGPLKPTSFRIANFPAITDSEMDRLMEFLSKY